METFACSSTFLLAILLMFSVHGLAVVARVRLATTRYVILEGEEKVCIDVINDDFDPQSPVEFTVTYAYNTILSGVSGSTERTDQVFFSHNSTAQFCITHHDDTMPCERNITGEVNLRGSDLVDIGEPDTATVTIIDDDFINASFVEAFYTLTEGGNGIIPAFVNISQLPDRPVAVKILQESFHLNSNQIERSLLFEPTTIFFQNIQEEIMLNIQDDDVALEDAEVVVMRLSVPSQAACPNVYLSPFEMATLLIIDNDNVTLKLMERSGTVLEGESYSACVALTQHIARELEVLVIIRSGTADTNDLAMESEEHMLRFTPTSEITKCLEIHTIQDHTIEGNELFQVELRLETVLPASINKSLKYGVTSSTITIQDTSTCTEVQLSPTSSDPIYVQGSRTLCFSCTSCAVGLFWNITSYQGHIWEGTVNQRINSPFRSEILANGNLLIYNSSLVFSKTSPGTISFSDGISSNVSQYEVYIQEGIEITELNVSCTNGNFTTVTCHFRGSPAPQVTWWAGSPPNKLLENSKAESDGRNRYRSTLLVESSVSSTYTCRVSNGLESQDSSVNTFQCGKNISKPINSSAIISSRVNYYLMSLITITLITSQYM